MHLFFQLWELFRRYFYIAHWQLSIRCNYFLKVLCSCEFIRFLCWIPAITQTRTSVLFSTPNIKHQVLCAFISFTQTNRWSWLSSLGAWDVKYWSRSIFKVLLGFELWYVGANTFHWICKAMHKHYNTGLELTRVDEWNCVSAHNPAYSAKREFCAAALLKCSWLKGADFLRCSNWRCFSLTDLITTIKSRNFSPWFQMIEKEIHKLTTFIAYHTIDG